MDAIAGVVDRIVFHSEDTGFCVLAVKVPGRADTVTVVGHAPDAAPGEYVNADGQWVLDKRHGRQFKADVLRVTPPGTREGIERYLGSGIIKGIGPHFAKKLVCAFGEGVFDIIEHRPDLLLKIDGIGRVRKEKITSAWSDQKAVREIMVFLQSHGVSTARAFRIFKEYGNDAIDVVRENPYRLVMDISGIGFKSADRIAANVGIEKTSMMRAQAGVDYVLYTLTGDGHCAYPLDGLIRKASELLEIPDGTIQQAAQKEVEERHIVSETIQGTEYIYPAYLYHAETGLAHYLTGLIQGGNPLAGIDAEKAVEWVQRKIGLELSPSQKDAIGEVIGNKVLVITGGPGVGKTTLVDSILRIFTAKRLRCLLCAPTGRAAKRLSEATRREAKTIHRLLEYSPHEGAFRRDAGNPLSCDVVIVDEISMVDLTLMFHLVRAIPADAVLIMVGDVDQLPSVGPGNVLSDLTVSSVVPVVRLTEVFRQAAESRIIVNAHRINQGRMPALEVEAGEESDFYFVEAETPEDVLSTIIELVTERIPSRFDFDSTADIQVLTPMKRSVIGTHMLNAELQKVLNPKHTAEVSRFGTTYHTGDKVMQIQNNYEKDVFNGDIGFITGIDDAEQILIVTYDGRAVEYDFREIDQMVLAYACTIHKSQGSEYPAVVIPVHTQHYVMLQRNLLYTGVTRSRELVVLVGTKKAMSLAINRNYAARRYSFLKERLIDLASED